MQGVTPREAGSDPLVYAISILYVADLLSGLWILGGVFSSDSDLFLLSLLNWALAWVLCYLGYRRSKTFGKGLAIVTVVLTIFIFAAVVFLAWATFALTDDY